MILRIGGVVSAGFCSIENNCVYCYGGSVSLRLKSNEFEDSKFATKYVFGIDAMIEFENNNIPNK